MLLYIPKGAFADVSKLRILNRGMNLGNPSGFHVITEVSMKSERRKQHEKMKSRERFGDVTLLALSCRKSP